ncbi:MAG: hypothetical protein ACK5SP_01270 [bacterium]
MSKDFWKGYVPEPVKPDTLSLEQLLRAAVYWGATYAKGDYHNALEGKIDQWISLRSGATPPAQRQWVGLTPEETKHMMELFVIPPQHIEMVVQAIEAKLKEKNNG